ncbi:anhydro-N-acetylmuramic acid kinase [Tenacibaculum geojense]|uniref:Anhydro-N-acetylmuramic acid kinase n=1 Tax=Tenacibaculum geojense TaxID=915352 RepID=A0ABW3JVI6_9FLAO
MQNDCFYVIGLMSGTSLDGIDLVYVSFDKKNYQNFKILAAKTYEYNSFWQSKLANAINSLPADVKVLDVSYGRYLAEVINVFTDEFSIQNLDFIASHGHTVFHQPDKGITLQIGNGQTLANITQQQVICDFRSQDVALGGQGAPLVPIGDELLFKNYDYCINLGGFANISYKFNDNRVAFDVCPVNIVLNHYAQKLGKPYDKNGDIAANNSVNTSLLKALNSLPFYTKLPPKSLGLEWVKETVFPLINRLESSPEKVIATFSQHVAQQLATVVRPKTSILVTGGGAFNSYLIQELSNNIQTKINLPSQELINFKEALIFAFLGVLRFNNEVNCLKSVTGAQKNHSSGEIFNAV